MPQVAKPSRQLDTGSLPGARRGAADTAESLGAGLEQAKQRTGGTIAALGDVAASKGVELFTKIQHEERQKADRVAVQNASNELDAYELALNDPKTGAYNKRGQDAFGLPETVDKDYRDLVGKLEKSLGNDTQKAAFQQLSQSRGQQIHLNVQRHVSREIAEYERSTVDAVEANAGNLAIQNALDPSRVGVEMYKGINARAAYERSIGTSPEVIQAKIDAFRSNVHVGVIRNLVAQPGQGQSAAEYFAEVKSEIAADQLDDVTKWVTVSSVRADAQQAADAIIAAGGTLAEQRAKAKAITDAKPNDPHAAEVRDEVENRIEHEATITATRVRAEAAEQSRQVYDILDRTHDVRQIPADAWADMDGNDRAAARRYAETLAGPGAGSIKTNANDLYDLLTLSSTDADAFLKTNLLRYKNTLSPADLEQMMRMQADIRKAGNKAAPAAPSLFVSERIQNQIADEAMTSLGLNATPEMLRKDPKLAERVGRFRRAQREAIARLEAKTQKPATDQQVQQITDTLIAPAGARANGIFGTPIPTYAFETAQAQISQATDIPKSVKPDIDAWLKAHGFNVNDKNRVSRFNEYLSDVRKDR